MAPRTNRLSDTELRVMDVIWSEGEASASRIAGVLKERYGYDVTTVYTLISRCIKKGAVERIEPGYVCRPLIPQEKVQAEETDGLIDRLFGGSADRLFAALVKRKKLSAQELDRLRAQADDIEAGE